jgi:acylphosphatase
MVGNQKAHVIISGRVQGVFFRAETRRAAERIGVTGWVRNRPDGTVEAVFDGNPQAVKDAIAWCHRGSPMSKVEDVQVTWEESDGAFTDFSIR